jgi:hypothetical protein
VGTPRLFLEAQQAPTLVLWKICLQVFMGRGFCPGMFPDFVSNDEMGTWKTDILEVTRARLSELHQTAVDFAYFNTTVKGISSLHRYSEDDIRSSSFI